MEGRRAAGALLALAACIACSAAAPTASNHTALDLYEAAPEGCYYNFQHYGEGDRIMTNEPCLNCTCHNRMLMCYLRVCPFTKPIGQDCTVEKRADQCCPIVTCPDVPVDLLTSTSTTSPAEYGATGLGKLDKYGCSISGKYFPEGSKVPPTPNKPCEHCYCIRNMTTCVMQECTLHVDGCTPIYHKDVCCPVRYSCDHPEDEMPLLDDMSTTVRPTPGFLLTTTTVSPVTQMTQDCVHNDQIIADGASITTEKACEHCYCMKGDIVCVVQECGAPMENEGKNCTSLPPREGQCCPDTYICEGDELSTETLTDSTTDSMKDILTTLTPPRRGGVEGSGYRVEPSDGVYTESPTVESELEGSGEEQEPTQSTDAYEPVISGKPVEPEAMTPDSEDAEQYIPVTTKAPIVEEPETTTKQIGRDGVPDDMVEQETIEPDTYQPTTHSTVQKDLDRTTTGLIDEKNIKPQGEVTSSSTFAPESLEKVITESGESLNTGPDIVPEQENDRPQDYHYTTTGRIPSIEESKTAEPLESEGTQATPTGTEQDSTKSSVTDEVADHLTQGPGISDESTSVTTEKSIVKPEFITEKESKEPASIFDGTTSIPAVEESKTQTPEATGDVSPGEILTEKETAKPELDIPTPTSSPIAETEKFTTEPDHAQNTVAINEEGYVYPHPSSDDGGKLTAPDEEITATEKITKDDNLEPQTYTSTPVSIQKVSDITTAEPDKGLNTIPSEIDEESSSQPSKTDLSSETKSTEPSIIVDVTEPQVIDIASTTYSEASTQSSGSHVTKADQYTVTTEPSFRREDEASVTTENPKEESAPTTIKAEFVDEGLIPTSTHDEKLSTGTDVSTIDEDITTAIPEYIEETVESKLPTTESTVISDTLPEKVTQSNLEQEVGLTSSTEKSVDVTVQAPKVESPEEPSRIPGEGDCLLNGVTYRNNTVVPSTNNCHTGCKCVSSIVKCDPIICMPPPDYMDNCQSIYDSPDSCCPTYVCDHPKETIPPQSDNQMSGTEPPVPPPVIECRGDQCELSEPTKAPIESADHCSSADCLPAAEQKPETSECGPEGCIGVKEPVLPQQSSDQPECTNEKCELPPTHSEPLPVKPCEGDDCKISDKEKPSTQLCENETDCKKVEVPITQTVSCEGDSCKEVDCGSDGCDSNVVVPPQDTLQAPCRAEDGCKLEENAQSDCTGDQPCRRKDVPEDERLPSKCEGNDCVQKTDTSTTQEIHQLSTEPSQTEEALLEKTTVKILPGEEELLSIPTPLEEVSAEEPGLVDDIEKETKKPDMMDEQHVDEDITTKLPLKPSVEEESSKISDTVDEEQTNKPLLVVEEGTKASEDTEKPTGKPDLVEEASTKPTEKPASVEAESTKIPDVEEEHTDKPYLSEEKDTIVPELFEKPTDKPALVEPEGTKIPNIEEEQTNKPDFIEIKGTISPMDLEENTDLPVLVEEEGTKSPKITEEYTDKPGLVEKDATTIPYLPEESTDKPTLVESEETKTPDIIVDQTDKPSLIEEEGTKSPELVEVQTDKSVLVEDEGTRTPEIMKEHTDKPDLIEEQGTKSPDVVIEQTDKPAIVEEEGTKGSIDTIGHTEKPDLVVEEGTKAPELPEEQTDKKYLTEEEGIKGPTDTTELTEKPDIVEEEGSKVPQLPEEHTNKPALVEEEGTKGPEYSEEYTDKPSVIENEGTRKPYDEEKQTDKPALIEEPFTNAPEFTEEYTGKPAMVEVVGTKSPQLPEEQTDKPNLVDMEGTRIPELEEYTHKPADIPVSVEETGTLMPDVAENPTYKPAVAVSETDIIEEHTDKTISVEPEVVTDTTILPEDEIKEKPILVEEDLPEKTTVEKDGTELKPDKESASEPTTFEGEGTEYPQVTLSESTKTPILVDDDSVSPTEGEIKPDDKPEQLVPVIETGTEKPVLGEKVELHVAVDKEQETTVQPELVPQTPSIEDTRRTEGLEIPITESIKEVTSETSVEEHPEIASTEQEKTTQIPQDEHRTTAFEDSSNIKPVESVDKQKPEEEFFDTKVPTTPVSEQQDTKVTDKPTDEIVTQSITEQEKATKAPLPTTILEEAIPPLREGQDETKTPDLISTTESVEKITKSSEPETITEEGEIYTDMPEQEGSVTKSPGEIIIEPQEGRPSESSDLPMPDIVVDATTIKAYEKDSTPTIPESHVTETSQYEGSSIAPELEISKATGKPEIVDTETQKMPTPSDHFSEQEIKPTQPEIFTPEKEEMITSTIISAVTEPVKFTEKADSLVTGKTDTTTKYEGETTERLDPTVTEKIDQNLETTASSSETSLISTTKGPAETYTESQGVYTETPVLKETKPAEVDIPEFITTESSDLPQKIPDSGIPSTDDQDLITEKSETKGPDTSDLPATELPVSIVTESQEKLIPVVDTVRQDEKTTITPESDKPSIPEVPEDQTATEISDSQVTESTQPEEPKPTESEIKDIPKTTVFPEIAEKPEDTETQAPQLLHTEPHDTDKKAQPEEEPKSSTEFTTTFDEIRTELPHVQGSTESSMSLVTESRPDISIDKESVTEKEYIEPTIHETHTESQEKITEKPEDAVVLPDVTTSKPLEEVTKSSDQTSAQAEFSSTTPYLIELEEHTHKIVDEVSSISPSDADVTTTSITQEEQTSKPQDQISTDSPSVGFTEKISEVTPAVTPVVDESISLPTEGDLQSPDVATENKPEDEIESTTKQAEIPLEPSDESSTGGEPVDYKPTTSVPEVSSEKLPDVSTVESTASEKTTALPSIPDENDHDQTDVTTSKSLPDVDITTQVVPAETEKSPVSESNTVEPTKKEPSATEEPLYATEPSRRTTVPDEEVILSTTKATPIEQEEIPTSDAEDKYGKPEEKPTSEVVPPTSPAELPKPPSEMQPTDETTPDEEGHFPPSGYGEPDYVEEDQAFGPGTCRYGGKVYVSAQQIPRDDPCDFCFCFRSDIICLQQSCPPPIHGCHEEPIQGFCCPRYECPVSMATTVNVTTTTTTTTTTLPPHFPTHSYKGAAQRRGCQIKGHTYKVGEVVRSSSGPCLHCTCGGDGQMKCDPKACTPEPMLRQMIAAAVSAKRRR